VLAADTFPAFQRSLFATTRVFRSNYRRAMPRSGIISAGTVAQKIGCFSIQPNVSQSPSHPQEGCGKRKVPEGLSPKTGAKSTASGAESAARVSSAETTGQVNYPKPTTRQVNYPKLTTRQVNYPKLTPRQVKYPKPTTTQVNYPKPTTRQVNYPKPTTRQSFVCWDDVDDDVLLQIAGPS